MVSNNQVEVLLALLDMLIQSCIWKSQRRKCLQPKLPCELYHKSEPEWFVNDKKFKVFSFNTVNEST